MSTHFRLVQHTAVSYGTAVLRIVTVAFCFVFADLSPCALAQDRPLAGENSAVPSEVFRFENYDPMLEDRMGDFNEKLRQAAEAALSDLYEIFPIGSSVDALSDFIASSPPSRWRYCEVRDTGDRMFCQYAYPSPTDRRITILWWLNILFDPNTRLIKDIRVSVRPS